MTVQRKTLSEWIATALPGILPWVIALLASAYTGYNTGLTKIAALEAKDRDRDEHDRQTREFNTCIVRQMDWLSAGAKGAAPCVLEVPE